MLRFSLLFILMLSFNGYASELEDSQELVGLLKTNSKLHNLKFTNIIVQQGNDKKLSSGFYTIINNEIVDILSMSKQHNVKHTERKPYLNIIGTPTSLKISNDSKKKIVDIAVMHNADAVFFWNLINYKNNLYFTAKVIDVASNKTLWAYQKDIKKLRVEQKEMMHYSGPLEIPLQSSMIFSGNFDYIVAENNIQAESMIGVSAEYLTTTRDNPLLSVGVIGGLSTAVVTATHGISIAQLLIDFRYQLNDYMPPLYDSATGDILKIQNRVSYSVGTSFGASLVSVETAKSQYVAPTSKLYFNATFTENFESNIGLSYMAKHKFELNENPKVQLGGINIFVSIGYKFNFDKDK